jgi:hypothetical protein
VSALPPPMNPIPMRVVVSFVDPIGFSSKGMMEEKACAGGSSTGVALALFSYVFLGGGGALMTRAWGLLKNVCPAYRINKKMRLVMMRKH